jgi:hypothetical protein
MESLYGKIIEGSRLSPNEGQQTSSQQPLPSLNGNPTATQPGVSPDEHSIRMDDLDVNEILDASLLDKRLAFEMPMISDSSNAPTGERTPLEASSSHTHIPVRKELIDRLLWGSVPEQLNDNGAVLTQIEVNIPGRRIVSRSYPRKSTNWYATAGTRVHRYAYQEKRPMCFLCR